MDKTMAVLAAVMAGGVFCGMARAGVGSRITSPADDVIVSPELPKDLSSSPLQAEDPRLIVGGLIDLSSQPPQQHQIALPPELTLRPASGRIFVYSNFVVGHANLLARQPYHQNAVTWRSPASTHAAADSAFIRSLVVAPSGFEQFCDRFDVSDEERPWSDTTTVHFLSSTTDRFEPFAAFAYEEDSLEEYDRFGIGGGLQIKLDDHSTFGAETLYFGDRLNETMARETRFMAKFEVDF